jgi:ubiquinone/menaquinone biosynthesis C-methylase UbiE
VKTLDGKGHKGHNRSGDISMDANESIDKTRQEFETSFSEKKYYDVQTYDDEHLNRIMNSLDIQEDFHVMDLGTGNGFLAFPLAQRYPESTITGLDIVPLTLDRNKERAKNRNIQNVDFISYDGMDFPFGDESFDVIVTRYCLHHFPDIERTFREISRVLKPYGQLFISDPTPNEEDKERFADTFMKMKEDGHIKLYTKEELDLLAQNTGLDFESSFDTLVRFPRKEIDKYLLLSAGIPENIIEGYHICIEDKEVYITEKVLNLSYRKKVQFS